MPRHIYLVMRSAIKPTAVNLGKSFTLIHCSTRWKGLSVTNGYLTYLNVNG